jgi:hypothetical protein
MFAVLAGTPKKKGAPAAVTPPPPTGRPSMVDILAGASKKKKSSPAAEPPKAAPPDLLSALKDKASKLTPGSDRVLWPREEKPPIMMEEMMAKKLRKTAQKK